MKTLWLKKEIIIVIVAWMLVFASDPLYMYYNMIMSQFTFRWKTIFELWMYDAAFMILFLIHHFILVPRLIGKKRVGIYVVSTIICLVAFTVFLVLQAHVFQADHIHDHGQSPGNPPLLSPPDMARLVMAMLMIGVDLGAVAWLNEQKLRQKVLMLEQQELKHELAQLRYQINPHFFMNTLNNIHALVDLDQEKAKRSIVELSKMMRYSLYEGNESVAQLQHEIEFIQLYISLMTLRYSNKVELYCNLPNNVPSDATIPPLLFATFIENAFKHGISYQRHSYVAINLALEDDNSTIHFHCENSLHDTTPVTTDEHHGIGLANVRKRLNIQYSDRYKLSIEEPEGNRYVVDLTLPSKI